MKQLKLLLFACTFLVFSGCEKDEPTKSTPTPTAAFYATGKFDGKDVLRQDGIDNYGSGAGAAGGNSSGAYEAEQSVIISNMALQKATGFSIIKDLVQEPTQCSEIQIMFHTGSYPYARYVSGSSGALTDGAIVMHIDDNGTEWGSNYGSADQTGSTFEIVEQIANNDGWSSGISKARFSCKLYDKQGNMKMFTTGEIRGRSVQCNNL
jgi:hypothetical protein